MPKAKPELVAVEDSAEEAESEDLVTFEFNGVTFELPRHRGKWPTRAILQFSRAETKDDQIKGVETLIGPAQWDRLIDEVAPLAEQFDEFMELFSSTVADKCVV